MDFQTFNTEDRRLVILRILFKQKGYRSNFSVLYRALENFGHAASRDLVASDFAWLEEQGLLLREAREIRDAPLVLALTPRGADVAEGRAVQPGVRRPDPGEETPRGSA